MRKFMTFIFLPLFAFGMLCLEGCSNSGSKEEKTEVVLISEPEMEDILTNSGWDIQSTTAASFHLWEQLNPSILLLAENKNSEVLIIGEFETPDMAKKAYESAVPLTDDSVIQTNENGHLQALVPLGDDQGYWLFRQAGRCLMGGWMADPASQEEFEILFDSFQTNAPVKQDETHIPTDDPASTPNDVSVPESQESEPEEGGDESAEEGSEEVIDEEVTE